MKLNDVMNKKSIFVLALILIFAGCITKGFKRAEKDKEKEPSKAPVVFIDQAVRQEISDVLTYPVRLMPISFSTLVAEHDGIVEKVKTNLGRPVKIGEELITIKNADPVYKDMILSSPIKGIVSAVEVSEGTRVQKGQKIATVADTSKLKGVMEIAASDLSKFSAGLDGTLKVNGVSEEYAVKITGISPMIDPSTGTASSDLMISKVPNPKSESKTDDKANGTTVSGSLPAGGLGKATFKVNQHQGVQVPEHIVIYKGKDTFIRIVDGSKAKLVPVTLGLNRQGSIEIVTGLDSGAIVVTRTSSYVADGEEVVIQNPEVAKK